MSRASSTVLGTLDALPWGFAAGVLAFVAAAGSGTGLPPFALGGLIALAVFLVLATVSVNRYRADGTRLVVTRTAIDAAIVWV